MAAPPPPPVRGQQPVFRTRVDLVVVEATVVTRAGAVAKELGAADFRVSIQGRPREVVSAEFVEYEAPAARGQRADPDITTNASDTARRNVLVVVDQSSLRFESRGVLEGAKRWLSTLGRDDRLGFVGLPAPGPVVDFTTNHARVIAAFGELNSGIAKPAPPYPMRNVSLWEAFQIRERNDLVRREVIGRECRDGDPTCPSQVDSNAQAIATAPSLSPACLRPPMDTVSLPPVSETARTRATSQGVMP